MKAWQGSQPLYPQADDADYLARLRQALPPEWRDRPITDDELKEYQDYREQQQRGAPEDV